MKKIITTLALALCINTHAQIITTIAGTGTSGFSGDGGAATAAQLSMPLSVATDAAGNVYIADMNNRRIRKVSTNGIITTIAGNGTLGFSGDGGAATAAQLFSPSDVAVDATGNVYIADMGNQRIRKVSTGGIITTIAGTDSVGFSGDGGQATAAELNFPRGVAVDAAGNVYIADNGNNRIRKVSTNGIITTFAGSGATGQGNGGFSGDGGLATAAQLNQPGHVAVDAAGNVYITDAGNYRIRKVSTNGIITTIAGTGTAGFSGDGGLATAAQLSGGGITTDAAGNVYIADWGNYRIRKVSTNGIITTIAGAGIQGFNGDGVPATFAQFNQPIGVAVDASGKVYVADYNNHRIRGICSAGTNVVLSAAAATICLGSSVSLTASGGVNTYTWSTGQTGTAIAVQPATNTTYIVVSYNTTGSWLCGGGSTVSINVTPPPPVPKICLVSTDSASNYNYNIVYWENTQYPMADSVFVYRHDVVQNSYLKIGAVAANVGQYMDTARHTGSTMGTNGNPNYGSFRYKIALKDTCGNVSGQSYYHLTEFLQNQQNGNFNVSHYQIESPQANPVTGYALYRDNTNTGSYALIAAIPNGATSASDPQYSNFPNANYRVDIFGFNCNGGASAKTTALIKAHSNTAIPITTTTPNTPLNLTATNNGSLTNYVSWTDNSSNENNFVLYYKTGTGSATYSTLATLPANATTYTHSSLTYSTVYCYQVTANNGTGSSAFSNTACAATPAEPIDTTGIGKLKDGSLELRVYPNPVSSVLSVESPLSHKGGMIEILITDVLGKEIKNETLKIENGAAQINVSNLPKGIYFIKAEANNYPPMQSKFVKE